MVEQTIRSERILEKALQDAEEGISINGIRLNNIR